MPSCWVRGQLNFPQVLASLLAIDCGSEWIKASLMKPGTPFDILLNNDSKCKIQSSIGWKNDNRLFGFEGYNLVSNHGTCSRGPFVTNLAQATRFPTDSFNFLKCLQDAPIESEAVSYYATLPAANSIKPSRNTISLADPMEQSGRSGSLSLCGSPASGNSPSCLLKRRSPTSL
jgi:hypoxia up-regulated 1